MNVWVCECVVHEKNGKTRTTIRTCWHDWNRTKHIHYNPTAHRNPHIYISGKSYSSVSFRDASTMYGDIKWILSFNVFFSLSLRTLFFSVPSVPQIVYVSRFFYSLFLSSLTYGFFSVSIDIFVCIVWFCCRFEAMYSFLYHFTFMFNTQPDGAALVQRNFCDYISASTSNCLFSGYMASIGNNCDITNYNFVNMPRKYAMN